MGEDATMERLNKLFFELSSAERISIMLELKKKSLKLSQVSRKMDLTVTESSRHLQRLREAKLIQKNTEGHFSVSTFGDLILSLISPLNFVTKNQKYFQEYNMSGVPEQFIERLGELEKSTYVKETFKNLEEGEKEIREAEEFVWILSNDIFSNTIPVLMEKAKKTFDLRIILPDGKFPPEDLSRLPSTNQNIQKGTLSRVDVLVVMTEKYAVFCLPDHKGRIDYTGFGGKDDKFHKWCKDLFLYYWNRAKIL
jgi:predicted transcriptional regulator